MAGKSKKAVENLKKTAAPKKYPPTYTLVCRGKINKTNKIADVIHIMTYDPFPNIYSKKGELIKHKQN